MSRKYFGYHRRKATLKDTITKSSKIWLGIIVFLAIIWIITGKLSIKSRGAWKIAFGLKSLRIESNWLGRVFFWDNWINNYRIEGIGLQKYCFKWIRSN